MEIEARFQKFIEKVLNPSDEEKQRIKSKLRKLENMMINNIGLPIGETIHAGSFAKGTMLKGRNEADVVFVLSSKYSDKSIDEVKRDLEIFFNNISNVTNLSLKPRAISFVYDGISIDLLIAKQYSSPSSMSGMSEKQQEEHYGYSSKYHVDLVKTKSTKYKDLVKLMKYWIKQYQNDFLCSSFLIELITAALFPEIENLSFPDAFKKLMEFIVDSQLNIFITFDYEIEYEPNVKKVEHGYIADPGNPENNILDSVTNKEQLIAYAIESLELAEKEQWEKIFGDAFPNEEGVIKKQSKEKHRKSQHPHDAKNRRYA